MVENIGRIAAGGLLVGLPDQELMEHYLVSGSLAIDTAVKNRTLLKFSDAGLTLLERTKVSQLADADVAF